MDAPSLLDSACITNNGQIAAEFSLQHAEPRCYLPIYEVPFVTDYDLHNSVLKVADSLVKSGIRTLYFGGGILLDAGRRVDEFSSEAWEQVIGVNLSGSFFCVKHAMPLMEKSGGGVLVLVASGAGISGGSSSVAYAASKGGVRGIALCVQGQLEPLNIRVHVALPANMSTHMRVKAVGDMAVLRGESRQEAEAVERAERGGPGDSATFLTELVSAAGATLAAGELMLSIGDWERLNAAAAANCNAEE